MEAGVRVAVRFKPLVGDSTGSSYSSSEKNVSCVRFLEGNSLEVVSSSSESSSRDNYRAQFTFDTVLQPEISQEHCYEMLGSPLVQDVMRGINATLLAYGQTGSGKTFSMFGSDVECEKSRGITPRAMKHIFDRNQPSRTQHVKCSFVEIYMEQVRDLLNPQNTTPLRVRESSTNGVWLDGVVEEEVSSEEEALALLQFGEKYRKVAFTQMNATSSRSHTIFIVSVHQELEDGSTRTGKLNLCDLAGSEKVEKTGAVGQVLDEAKKINQSLSSLGNCIHALTSKQNKRNNSISHIPYRDSKLTFLLRESLGGNTKTTLLVAASSDMYNLDETITSLKFASRAKAIKNTVKVNKEYSKSELLRLVSSLKEELAAVSEFSRKLEETVALRSISDTSNAAGVPLAEMQPIQQAEVAERKDLQQKIDEKEGVISAQTEFILELSDNLESYHRRHLNDLKRIGRATLLLHAQMEKGEKESGSSSPVLTGNVVNDVVHDLLEKVLKSCGAESDEEIISLSEERMVKIPSLHPLHALRLRAQSLASDYTGFSTSSLDVGDMRSLEEGSLPSDPQTADLPMRAGTLSNSSSLSSPHHLVSSGIESESVQNSAAEKLKELELELQHEKSLRLAAERKLAGVQNSMNSQLTSLRQEVRDTRLLSESIESSQTNILKKYGGKPSFVQLLGPTKEGFLTKQGGKVKNWKKRWCAIRDKFFYYFKSREDNEPTGVVELESIQVQDAKTNRKFSFEVWGPKTTRHFIFSAENEDEKQQWIRALLESAKMEIMEEPLVSRTPSVTDVSSYDRNGEKLDDSSSCCNCLLPLSQESIFLCPNCHDSACDNCSRHHLLLRHLDPSKETRICDNCFELFQ